jgi:hypothetical protein
MLRMLLRAAIVVGICSSTIALHVPSSGIRLATRASPQAVFKRQQHSPLQQTSGLTPELTPVLNLRGGAGETSLNGLIISLVKNIVGRKKHMPRKANTYDP